VICRRRKGKKKKGKNPGQYMTSTGKEEGEGRSLRRRSIPIVSQKKGGKKERVSARQKKSNLRRRKAVSCPGGRGGSMDVDGRKGGEGAKRPPARGVSLEKKEGEKHRSDGEKGRSPNWTEKPQKAAGLKKEKKKGEEKCCYSEARQTRLKKSERGERS